MHMDTITEDSDEGRASAKLIDPIASLHETSRLGMDKSINSDEENENEVSNLNATKSKSTSKTTQKSGITVAAGITKEGEGRNSQKVSEKKRVSFSPEEMVHPNEEGLTTT